MMMADDDDGFITTKTHRKKRNDTTTTTTTETTKSQTKLRERNTTSTTNNTIRFGGKQWAKPSTTVTTTSVATNNSNETTTTAPPPPPPPSITTTDNTLPQSTVPLDSVFGIHFMSEQNSNSRMMMKSMWLGQQEPPQSLASLLEDYGTYDPNWMKMEPTNMVHENDNNDDEVNTEKSIVDSSIPNEHINEDILVETPAEDDQQQPVVGDMTIVNGINRLQLHGHAPIHVEFVSFGYRYGIPSEIRYYSTGNCYTQPLLPFDTRTVLAPIPNYLSHIDGKAGIIKTTMLKWRSVEVGSEPTLKSSKEMKAVDEYKFFMNVRDYVNTCIIPPVTDAIVEAIDIGQHGYVSPITISIYIGSELGKHRSVVTAELAAIALRKLLRTNQYNRFQCPISVAGRHRDILNSQNHTPRHTTTKSTTSKKQKAFEEDD